MVSKIKKPFGAQKDNKGYRRSAEAVNIRERTLWLYSFALCSMPSNHFHLWPVAATAAQRMLLDRVELVFCSLGLRSLTALKRVRTHYTFFSSVSRA
jgi:hypothetical protein